MRSMERTSGLTYADLLAYDDQIRREIIDGELFVTPSPRFTHQDVVGQLFLLLAPFVRDNRLGTLLVGPYDAVLNDRTVCAPDLVFIANEHIERLNPKNVHGAPTLIVEVLSDSRHDRIRKRDAYGRAGVPEYWIADPESEWIEVYRLIDGRYGKPEILEPGDVLTSRWFPGLEIDLTALFGQD